MVDRSQEIAETARLARRAVELGDEDAIALCAAGFALAFVVHELDDGVAFIDRGLMLNPNYSMGWALSGWTMCYLGRPEAAIERLARAMRLSPRDSYVFGVQAATAYAHFIVGRYDQASAWAREAVRNQPRYTTGPRIAAAANALAGRPEEAKKAVALLQQIDPAVCLSGLRHVYGPYRPEDLARIEEGLRKAGLPE